MKYKEGIARDCGEGRFSSIHGPPNRLIHEQFEIARQAGAEDPGMWRLTELATDNRNGYY